MLHGVIKLNLFSNTSECCVYDGTKPYNRYEPQQDTTQFQKKKKCADTILLSLFRKDA
jgi:glucan phosphoethanolaminetransferase (alkaline phosphatase superfamily)